MYILENALKNVVRNKGRNILVGMIIFAIITTTVVALMINNTAGGIIDDYKTRFGSEVVIAPDIEKIIAQAEQESGGRTSRAIPQITASQALEFADSEYIKEAKIDVTQPVAGVGLEPVEDEGGSIGGLRGGGMTIRGGNVNIDENYITPQFMLRGNYFEGFDDGTRSIVEGRMVEADEECLVSIDFANLNNLSIGDVIELENTAFSPETGVGRTVVRKLTVVGFYYDFVDDSSNNMPSFALMDKRNEILTTLNSVVDALLDGETGIQANVTYFLKNPDMLSDFEAEVRAKGLDENMSVSTDEAGYKRVVGPVEGLKDISMTFMIIVLSLGLIILVLLSSIAIRERKYEIGVLRAMGMKKGKVAFGIWSEMMVITAVCLVLGFFVGVIVSQPVTDILLKGQIEVASEAMDMMSRGPVMIGLGGRQSVGETLTALDTLDVSLSLVTFIQIIVLSLTLVSFAGLVVIQKITKYEPIKILMERN